MPEQKSHDWRATVRRRVWVLAGVFALWVGAIEARLVYLQGFRRAEFQTVADKAHKQRIAVPARRGEILDRHGRVLAFSVDADSIYAIPSAIKDPVGTCAAVCAALGDCTPGERRILTERFGRKALFAHVRRQVTPAQKERVARLNLQGIAFRKDPRRAYPNQELAAHVLGYVGTDDQGDTDSKGLSGIEARYDREIAGKPGEMLVQLDARGGVYDREGTLPTAGTTLELTIDEVLQHIAERELAAGVAAHRAASASVVIMDPQTGEILALANVPTFNPNAFAAAGERAWRNRAIQDVYEPGSTFKVVTASAAIEERVVAPTDPIDVSEGRIRLGSRVVDDFHRYNILSFADVVVKSSNVGAIKIGQKLGAERLGRYVQRFGFGTRLSPDFWGENAGIVWSTARWSDSTLASVSMGYEIGVTPLQMSTAVSAVANGGVLVQPRIVRAAISNNVRTELPHRRIRQVITPATAAELTAMMEGVVERGTATAAQIPHFTVAGKTGTAAKLVNGHYSKTDYNASFVGFVPSRRPALTILVMIDSPRGEAYTGGAVAAPVFGRIAEAALQYLGIGPSINPPPAVLVARRPAGPEVRAAARATVATMLPASLGPPVDDTGLPDLRGLGLREALRLLTRLGATARVTGAGVVIEQDPPAGSALEPGATCRLVLGR